MPDEEVAVIEGPKGKAQIIEVWSDGRLIEYQVRFDGNVVKCFNIGEAYIEAGQKVGVKT